MNLATLLFSTVMAQEAFVGNDMQMSIKVFDANGKPFVNPPADIDGTPFFSNEWKYGVIRLHDNSVYKKIQLRINLQSQEIHFLTINNIEMSFPAGFVKDILLFDSMQIIYQQYSFQSGFPSIDYQDQKNLYRVVSDGKIKLLESLRKKVIIEKDDMSGKTTKEYRTYENYYFFLNNSMQRMKKDKTLLLNILADKRDIIEQYIK